MKTALKIAAGIGALSALASTAHAQNSATATAAGSATIIQAISLANNTGLAFGAIVKPTSGTGTVSIDATTGARTLTGVVSGGALASNRATFTASGEGASTFSISVPSTFSLTTGTNSLVVTTSQSATTATLSGSIGTTGSQTFGVGGTINVASATASGAYTGNLVVTVQYN